MSAYPVAIKGHHLKYMFVLALLLTFAGIVTPIRVSTIDAAVAPDDATESNPMTTCGFVGDFFELDAPGTYTAFAMTSTGLLPTYVRGDHGEVLATTNVAAYNTVPVDGAAGAPFGIAPSEVFELTSSVMINVERQDAPYELVVVRLGSDANEGRIDLRPPVERVLNESASCLIGELHEYLRIRTDAVYSDLSARQVFVISPSSKA